MSNAGSRGRIRVSRLDAYEYHCENISDHVDWVLPYHAVRHYFNGLSERQWSAFDFLIKNRYDVIIDNINWKLYRPKAHTRDPVGEQLGAATRGEQNRSRLTEVLDDQEALSNDIMNNYEEITGN